MTQIKKQEMMPAEFAMLIKSTEDVYKIADVFAKSGMFPDSKSMAQCAVKIMAGHEMGIPPFAAMTGIHLIQGKPTLGATLMASKVKQSGKYDYKILYMEDDGCEIEFFEMGKTIGKSKFTLEDAKIAGLLGKSIWKQYPRNMCHSRAISNGIKWYCSDVFLGAPVYTKEELANDAPQEVDVTPEVVQQEEVDVLGIIDSYLETMQGCQDYDELRNIFEKAYKFARQHHSDDGMKKLKEVYDAVKELLLTPPPVFDENDVNNEPAF